MDEARGTSQHEYWADQSPRILHVRTCIAGSMTLRTSKSPPESNVAPLQPRNDYIVYFQVHVCYLVSSERRVAPRIVADKSETVGSCHGTRSSSECGYRLANEYKIIWIESVIPLSGVEGCPRA